MNKWEKPTERKTSPELLAAARGDDGTRQSGRETIEIHKSRLIPDPNQPRKNFIKTVIDERQKQLEAHGQESPIEVLPGYVDEDGLLKYQLIDGECRWRAALQSDKIDFLRAEIRSGNNDEESILYSQLLSNDDGSEAINNFERAIAWQRAHTLREEAGSSTPMQDVADRLGKSIDDVSRVIALASAPDEVKAWALENGVDDPKVLGSIRQVEKRGSDNDLAAALSSLTASLSSGGNVRQASAALAADVKARSVSGKGKDASKAKASKKEVKPVRNLGASLVKLNKKPDGSGILEIVTPREHFRFKLPDNIASLIEVLDDG